MSNPFATPRVNTNGFLRFIARASFILASFLTLCYAISENNLFIDKQRALSQIQEKDLSVRSDGDIENNLIFFTVLTVHGEFEDKKFYIDAYFSIDENKKIVREYEIWPVNEARK